MAEETKVESSLEFIWDKWLEEFEHVNNQMDKNEAEWLATFDTWVENLNRNEINQKDFFSKIRKDQKDWLRMFREESLTMTSGIRFFAPIISVEEMDTTLEKLEDKVLDSLRTDAFLTQNKEARKKAYQSLEKYFETRSEMRKKVLESIKNTAEDLKQQQIGLLNIWEKQMKTLVFPFTSFIDKKAAN